MPDLSLEDLARKVLKLPALPQTAAAIIEVTSSPRTSAKDLKEVISTDQALVAKLLRVVNSPLYALRQKVTTVTHAIAMLGFDAVKNLALAASMSELLSAPAEGYGLQPGRLWIHSIAVGCAARAAAERAGHQHTEEAFVAGVIHDVGKLVIHVYVKGAYATIIEQVDATGRPFDQVEREVLGFNHAEAGAAVAHAWRLPEVLVEAIRYHHTPGEGADPILPSLVHVADVTALSLGYGVGVEGLAYVLDEGALTALNLTQVDLEQIALGLPVAVARLAENVRV